jgi:hypothetical protein
MGIKHNKRRTTNFTFILGNEIVFIKIQNDAISKIYICVVDYKIKSESKNVATSTVAANAATNEKRSTTKLDAIREIERHAKIMDGFKSVRSKCTRSYYG